MIAALVGALLAASPAKPAALPRPALDELALRVVEQAEGAQPEAPVGVYVEGVPPVLARAFASALSSQLAAKKRGPTVLEVPTAAEAEAVARAHDVRTLLRLSVQLDGQKLVARGDAIHTWVNFWAGASSRRDGGAVALAASVDADAQAIALGAPQPVVAPPTGPLKVGLTSFAKLTGVPAALAFGDVDGDGRPELAVLQEDGVVVLDPEGKPRWRSDLRDLAAAPSPSREPFGALAVASAPPRLLVASSRKARAAALVPRAGRLESAPAEVPLYADGVGVRPAVGLNVFERTVVLSGRAVELPAPFTSAASRGSVALVVYADGSGMLLEGTVPATRFTGAGAAAAMADLDGDGTPEVLLSSPRYAVDGDDLKVLSLAQAQALQARAGSAALFTGLWQGTTPRGSAIVALGADLDGDKNEELVIGVWLPDGTGELLVARAIR